MRAMYRTVGPLLATLVGVVGAAQAAHAWDGLDLSVRGITDSILSGDPYLFRWQTGTQVVDLEVDQSLYCEEASYASVEVAATVGDLAFFAAGAGAFGVWDVGCNYLQSPNSRAPNTIRVSVPVTPQGNTLAALTRAAKRGNFTATVVIDPVGDAAPFGSIDEGGATYSEVDNNTATRTFAASKLYGVLSGKVAFGGLAAQAVYGVGAAVTSTLCGDDYELIGVRYDFGDRLGEASTIIESSAFGRVCATPTLDPFTGEYDLVVSGVRNQPVKTIYTDWAGGLPSKLTFKVGSGGIVAQEAWVKLPAGVTAHREASLDIETYVGEPGRDRDTYLANPRGQSWIQFPVVDPTPVAGIDEITAATPAGTYYQLVTREVPLGFRFDQLFVSGRFGVGGVPVDTRYLRRSPVHLLDTRHYAKDGPRSNDVFLAGAGVPDQAITVTADGLSADLAYRSFGGHGATAFPRGDLQWGDDTRIKIEHGHLDAQVLPIVGFDLEQKTACPGCGSGSGAIRKIETRTVRGRYNVGVGADGAVLADVQQSAAEIGWGPTVTADNVQRPTFLRAGDINASNTLVLPGFALDAASGNPALALLGAWRAETVASEGETIGVPVRAAPLTDPEVKRGNGFFAGLNLGPEVYADAQNQPAPGLGRLLAASRLSIAFPTGTAGQYDVQNIPANNGAKFVVRSTVTGVFNTDVATAPQPQVYGYALAFSRFAFGLVDNTLAPTTWIDGGVTVHGHGEFSVPFTSLGLTCTGQLAGGLVDFGKLTPQSLKAWKTPFGIRSIGFVPKGSDTQCSTNPRELQAGGGVTIASLAKDVELAATWTPAGTPTGAKLAPILSRLEKTDTDPGFRVHTNADDLKLGFDPAETNRGWFDFGAQLLLPFWEAADVRLRLQNVQSGTALVGAPSLVVPKGFAPEASWAARWNSADNSTLLPMFAVTSHEANASEVQKAIVNSLIVRAKTQWVFELGGSVKWQPRDGQTSARFVASKRLPLNGEPDPKDGETDLKVASLKSAVPFVTSDATRFSMGVDADLRKISIPSIPSIKIDLNDPATLDRIDDFLVNVGITGRPMNTGLNGLRGAVKDLAAVAKGAFGPALKDALTSAIEALFNGLQVGSLLDLAASAVTQVQTLAQQAISAVFAPLSGLVDKAVGAVLAGPDQALYALYDVLPGLYSAARGGTVEAKNTLKSLADNGVSAVLTNATNAINSANTFLTDLGATTKTASAKIGELKISIDSKITTAQSALANLKTALNISDSPLFKCDTKVNPILIQLEGLKAKIYAVADTLAKTGNGAIGNAVQSLLGNPTLMGNKVDTKDLAKLFIDLEVLGKFVKEKVDNVYKKLISGDPTKPYELSFCAKTLGPTSEKLVKLAKKATEFIEKISVAIGSAKSALESAFTSLTDPSGPIAKFQTKLEQTKAALKALGDKLGELGKQVNDAASDVPVLPQVDLQAEMDNVAKAASALLGVGQSTWRVGNKSFLYAVGQKLADPVHALIGSIETAVGAELAKAFALVPLPKKEELLKHITTLVVNSEVVDEVIKLVTDNLSFLEDKANALINMLLDQLSRVIQAAFDAVHSQLSGLLNGVTAAFGDFPIKAASIKGFADILGNQIMGLQVDAHFDMNKGKNDTEADAKKTENKKSSFAFDAQMKVESWLANGKAAACGSAENDLSNAFDVSIGASNLPFEFGTGGLKISKLTLGFAINNSIPIGLFGGINTTGALEVGSFKLRNIAFAAGAGAEETYIGARAQAVFESVNAEVAFFAGRTCNFNVLKSLDPEAGKFIAIPTTPEPFLGVFAHGSVQIPFISAGCMLKIAFGAEAALWFFKSSSDAKLGGMFGGSVTGKALCFVAIRGAVRVGAEYSVAADEFNGTGEFFAGGGIGFSCDEDTWTSVQNIRNDSGCATVDVSATARLVKGKLEVDGVSTSGID